MDALASRLKSSNEKGCLSRFLTNSKADHAGYFLIQPLALDRGYLFRRGYWRRPTAAMEAEGPGN